MATHNVIWNSKRLKERELYVFSFLKYPEWNELFFFDLKKCVFLKSESKLGKLALSWTSVSMEFNCPAAVDGSEVSSFILSLFLHRYMSLYFFFPTG